MKNLLFILFCFILYSSCDKTEENTASLSGKWNLVYAQYGIAGYDNFAKNDIVWTFQNMNTVDVSINITLDAHAHLPIEQNGIFNTPSTDNKITLEGREYDYYFEDNKLIISNNPQVDGPLYRFERD